MTYKELYLNTKQRFLDNNIESAEYEVSTLMEKHFGTNRQQIVINGDKEISKIDNINDFNKSVNRRLLGEPLQYILGEVDFYGYKFNVGKGVLIPRDDTEVLVDCAIEFLKGKNNPTVADLCAGSGTICISIAGQVPNSTVYGIEISCDAFSYLENNTELNNINNLTIINADIFNVIDTFEDESLDLIVSNPPYIETNVIPTLQIEVQQEPKLALDGGADGYDFYRKIIDTWTRKLKQGCMIAFEIGENQEEYISKLLYDKEYENICLYKDIQNINRVITGIKKCK